jgi:broad specificity phosphatase PhoE
MTKFLLTRHGHVIKPERFRGREPLELTAQERSGAETVARRIAAAWSLVTARQRQSA